MSTSSNSTAQDLIPRKALFGNPDRVSPQLSPDGQKLSFLPLYGVLNVWVGPAGDPDLAEPVTQDTVSTLDELTEKLAKHNAAYLADMARVEALDTMGDKEKAVELLDRHVSGPAV